MVDQLKLCDIHGETPHATRKNGYLRCKKCQTDAVTKSRKKRKQVLVDYRGGCCELCGYKKYSGALEFHHINPEEKEFGLSIQGLTRSQESQIKECMKCVLLCSNCHRELHAGIISIPENYMPTVIESVIEKDRKFTYESRSYGTDVCVCCSTTYTKKSSQQKYCSDRCSRISRSKL